MAPSDEHTTMALGERYFIMGYGGRNEKLSFHPVTPLPVYDTGRCGFYNTSHVYATEHTGRACIEGASATRRGNLVPFCLDLVGSALVTRPGEERIIKGVMLAVQCDKESGLAFYTVEPIGPHYDWILSTIKTLPSLSIKLNSTEIAILREQGIEIAQPGRPPVRVPDPEDREDLPLLS